MLLINRELVGVVQINMLFIINVIVQQNDVCMCEDHKHQSCFGESPCIYGKRLDCSYNNVTFLNLNCDRPEVLIALNYNNNKITYFDENTFKNTMNLQHLYLSDNAIGRIENYTFSPLKKIQYLHLSNNKIEAIHRHSFKNLFNLLFVDLEGNDLTLIEAETFSNCRYLWQVHLSNNKIQKINESSFKNNSSLQHLYCSHNEIDSMEFLKKLPKLHFLNLSHNNIQRIPIDTFLHIKDLRKLDLSYNKLESLHSGTFNHLPVLTDLNLSHNKLKDLGEGPFDYLYTLNNLDVRNNFLNLFSYDNNFGRRGKVVLKIYIDDNEWRCDYLYKIKKLTGIEIIYYKVNESVSNIEGIPCNDRILYFKTSSSPSTIDAAINTTLQVEDHQSLPSSISVIHTETPKISIAIINTTTAVLITDTATSSSLQQTTDFSTYTHILNDSIVSTTTISNIQIDKSMLFIIGAAATLIMLIVLILSVRTCKRYYNSRDRRYIINNDYVMQSIPPRKSYFYVTLDACNEYEEIDFDSYIENDHIYEKID